MLVVVIGGIGLSGGKGGMRNVVVGALFIGIMLNAMTILDIPNIYQNLIKSTILLSRSSSTASSIPGTNKPPSRATSRPAIKKRGET